MMIKIESSINCIMDASAEDIFTLAQDAQKPGAQVRLIRTCLAESKWAPVVFFTRDGEPSDEQVARVLYYTSLMYGSVMDGVVKVDGMVDPDSLSIALIQEDGYENLYKKESGE